MKWMVTVTVGLALLGATNASAQRPDRNVEPPIARSYNWFAYVGANDIRSACQPGSRNRVRLIYNALYEEQVRTYEIFLQPDGTAGMAIGVLADQGNVSNLTIGSASDALGPWSMKRGERILSADETRELVGLLEASAAFGPPRDGLKLPDNDFWWTVASCRNGVWRFQAYHYPTDGFASVKFAERLFAWDNVPVPVNRPRKLEPSSLRRDWNAPMYHSGSANRWILVVGKDGLRPR